MRSPWLASAILEQPSRHVAAAEPSAESSPPRPSGENHASALVRELHFAAGVQTRPGAEILGNDDLALGADPMCHTASV